MAIKEYTDKNGVHTTLHYDLSPDQYDTLYWKDEPLELKIIGWQKGTAKKSKTLEVTPQDYGDFDGLDGDKIIYDGRQ